MRLYSAVIVAGTYAWAADAVAAVTVNEQIMQKGLFAKPHCQSDPKIADYDSCVCEADVRYPQIAGIQNEAAQSELNAWFRSEAAKTVCEGESVAPPAEATKPAPSHMSLSVHYEVTLSSPHILAFKFTDWGYTGGAHGNGSVIGAVADLDKGRLLGAADLFSVQDMKNVNKTIYDALAAKPEEEIFRDQIEARKDAFIKDNECQGCTLVLTSNGVHVLFQTYEVAPYGAGGTDVLIPAQYVANAAVKEALEVAGKK